MPRLRINGQVFNLTDPQKVPAKVEFGKTMLDRD